VAAQRLAAARGAHLFSGGEPADGLPCRAPILSASIARGCGCCHAYEMPSRRAPSRRPHARAPVDSVQAARPQTPRMRWAFVRPRRAAANARPPVPIVGASVARVQHHDTSSECLRAAHDLNALMCARKPTAFALRGRKRRAGVAHTSAGVDIRPRSPLGQAGPPRTLRLRRIVDRQRQPSRACGCLVTRSEWLGDVRRVDALPRRPVAFVPARRPARTAANAPTMPVADRQGEAWRSCGCPPPALRMPSRRAPSGRLSAGASRQPSRGAVAKRRSGVGVRAARRPEPPRRGERPDDSMPVADSSARAFARVRPADSVCAARAANAAQVRFGAFKPI